MAEIPTGPQRTEPVPDFPPIEEPPIEAPPNPGNDGEVIILDPEVIEEIPHASESTHGG